MLTLYERLTGWRELQRRKHDLGDDFVNQSLSELSREDFLKEISEALEELLNERSGKEGK